MKKFSLIVFIFSLVLIACETVEVIRSDGAMGHTVLSPWNRDEFLARADRFATAPTEKDICEAVNVVLNHVGQPMKDCSLIK